MHKYIYVYINYKYIYSMKSIFPGNLHLECWHLDSIT